MPAVGDRFSAPWGRYQVHRLAGDQVVLRDLDRPTACVTPTLAELAERYVGVELLAAAAARPAPPAPAGDRPRPAPPAPPAGSTARCADCGRASISLAIVRYGDVEVAYCGRCYGVVAERPLATGATSTGWTPPPGEAYESRAEVGSFERPPPADRVEHPRRERPQPRRVGPDEWLIATGEVRR
jgi:hypothetical protein